MVGAGVYAQALFGNLDAFTEYEDAESQVVTILGPHLRMRKSPVRSPHDPALSQRPLIGTCGLGASSELIWMR